LRARFCADRRRRRLMRRRRGTSQRGRGAGKVPGPQFAFGRKIPLGDAGGVILAKAKKFLRRFQLTTVSPD
jgi:hypothetical protein